MSRISSKNSVGRRQFTGNGQTGGANASIIVTWCLYSGITSRVRVYLRGLMSKIKNISVAWRYGEASGTRGRKYYTRNGLLSYSPCQLSYFGNNVRRVGRIADRFIQTSFARVQEREKYDVCTSFSFYDVGPTSARKSPVVTSFASLRACCALGSEWVIQLKMVTKGRYRIWWIQ